MTLDGLNESYRPQLDGLRALAVTAVVVHHLSLIESVKLSFEGVRLFFVLSGFLITGILLRCRDATDEGEHSILGTARQFYIRRFLRIFPLYYGTLAVLYLIEVEPWFRGEIGWHLAYLTNVLIVSHDGWVGLTSHFWSLAVEEQFYLLWPWIILLTPRRMIKFVLLCVVLAGPIFRFAMLVEDQSNFVIRLLLPSCLDTLGMGALVAVMMHEVPKKVPPTIRACGLIGLPLWLASLYIDRGRTPLFGFSEIVVIRDLGIALVYGWFVAVASVGVPGIVGSVLQSRPLVWVGRISYGIYVFHVFAWRLTISYLPDSWGWWAPRIVTLGLTLAIAALSWRVYEGPINRLKSRVPYPSTAS